MPKPTTGMRPPLGKLMYSMTDWPDEGEWLLKWLAWRSQSNCGPRRSAASVYCVCTLYFDLITIAGQANSTPHYPCCPACQSADCFTAVRYNSWLTRWPSTSSIIRRVHISQVKRSMISPSALIVVQVSGCRGKDKEDGEKYKTTLYSPSDYYFDIT